MKDLIFIDCILREYHGEDAHYEIPTGVTEIGEEAFFEHTELETIIIPDSVTKIGVRAFSDSGLTTVTLPESIVEIHDEAFCSVELTDVTIPQNVTYIGIGVFSSCRNLISINVDIQNPSYTSIDGVVYNKDLTTIIAFPSGRSGSFCIPQNVNSVGNQAFCGCTKLTEIILHDGVTHIVNGAFKYCTGLSSLMIPSSVQYIGKQAFMECCSLTSIIIPEGVSRVNANTFALCFNLLYVSIPNTVTTIESEAFLRCCRLPSIIIPDSVISIKDYAFYACHQLLMLVIPPSVTTIAPSAFTECNNLTVIKLHPDDIAIRRDYTNINNLGKEIENGLEMIRTGDYSMDLNLTIKKVFAMLHYLHTHDKASAAYIHNNLIEYMIDGIKDDNYGFIADIIDNTNWISLNDINCYLELAREYNRPRIINLLHYHINELIEPTIR